MLVCCVFQGMVRCPHRQAGGSVVNRQVSSLLYLGWDFELLHHSELEEAADAALYELQLWQSEVTESELEQLHLLGIGDVGSLHIGNSVTFSKPSHKEFMRSIVLRPSQCCLPTVCTSPSGHSPLVQSQTSLECSVGENWVERKLVPLICFQASWSNISSLPEWAARHQVWLLSGTWAFPG